MNAVGVARYSSTVAASAATKRRPTRTRRRKSFGSKPRYQFRNAARPRLNHTKNGKRDSVSPVSMSADMTGVSVRDAKSEIAIDAAIVNAN